MSFALKTINKTWHSPFFTESPLFTILPPTHPFTPPPPPSFPHFHWKSHISCFLLISGDLFSHPENKGGPTLYGEANFIFWVSYNKTEQFQTKNHLESREEIRTFQPNQKEMLSVINVKCYLDEKLEITSYNGDSSVNKTSELINKCGHQCKPSLLRHDSKD